MNKKNLFLKIPALIVWVSFSFLASQFIISFFLIKILGISSYQLSQPFWLVLYEFLNFALMLTLIVILPSIAFKKFSICRTDRSELGLEGSPTWIDIGLAPAGFIAYTIIAAILTAVFSIVFPWFDSSQVQNTGFDNLATNFDRIMAFIALVVVAPISEEIIFRGWLYGKLRKIIPKKLSLPISMLIVSILFGILHLQWNVGVNVFCLSLVLCAMREVTGTIYSGIFLHMLKNGIAFFLLYAIM